MTTAANIILAKNTIASQGLNVNARLLTEVSEELDALAALIDTLSTAVAGDTPGQGVIDAMADVDAQIIVVAAICPALSTYLA